MKTPNENAIGGLLDLKVALIDPDPKNRKPETKEAEEAVQSLSESIKAEGLLQPILVRLHPTKAGRYMLVAGERRWRAHGILKADTIEARLVKAGSSEVDAVRKRAVENLQRVDLSPIEEARQFRELVEDHKMSQPDVAKLAGKKSPSYVSNSLRLLTHAPAIQEQIGSGKLSRAHGVALARYARWPKVCELIAARATDEDRPIASKDLENEISYAIASELRKQKLGNDLNAWDFPNNKIPAEVLADPDVQKVGDEFWCFNWPRYEAIMKPIRDAEKAEQAAQAAKHKQAKPTDKGTVIEKVDEWLAVLLPAEKVGKRGKNLVCLDTARWNQILSAARQLRDDDADRVYAASATEARALLLKAKVPTAALLTVLFSDQDIDSSGGPGIDVLVGKEAKALGIKVPKWSYAAASKLDPWQLVKLQVDLRLKELASGDAYINDSTGVGELLRTVLGRQSLGFLHETAAGRAKLLEKLCEVLRIPKLTLPAGTLPAAPAKKETKKK